jgi:phage terminase small subunit
MRRKPAKVLELSGAFKHDPKRRREDVELEAISSEPPAHMSPEAQAIWRELVGIDSQLGNVKSYHAMSLELICTEMAEFRKNPAKVGGERLKNLRMLFKDFLMTPSDSLKLAKPVTGEDESNPFAEYANRKAVGQR